MSVEQESGLLQKAIATARERDGREDVQEWARGKSGRVLRLESWDVTQIKHVRPMPLACSRRYAVRAQHTPVNPCAGTRSRLRSGVEVAISPCQIFSQRAR